ncbi:MAG: phenylacetate--CoA ligase [Ignisphaera sp.]
MQILYWNSTLETILRSELEKMQLAKLKEQVKRVYERCYYYRRKMREAGIAPEDIRSLNDTRKLPFTTKDDLRDAYPYGTLAVDLSEVVEVHGSSGTTGKPTLSFYTQIDIENWSEVMARSLTAIGITKSDIVFIAYNYHMFTGGLGFHYGALKIGATAIPAGVGYTQRQIMMIKDLAVTMLTSVPNYALRLAEVAFEMGIDPAKDTRVRKGMFGAAPWSEEMRSRIEKIWEMAAYDMYGMSELYGPGVASECIHREGLHVWEDHYLVEVVDPRTGDVLEPEERGELVVTTLSKDAMPLIRYRTRDITRILDVKQCLCGRTHRKIDRIQGRTDDMFIVNGVNIWPSAIEEVLLREPLVAPYYQIVLERDDALDRMIVVVEAVKQLSDRDREILEKRIQRDLKEAIIVTPVVEVVDPGTLPRFDGKPKVVVDKRSI